MHIIKIQNRYELIYHFTLAFADQLSVLFIPCLWESLIACSITYCNPVTAAVKRTRSIQRK